MPVDWGRLNQQMQALMPGLQAQPWTFDPSQLTGDATANRARIYSGSAVMPPAGSAPTAPGLPGVAQAPQPQAAPSPFAAPLSGGAAEAPTQTAATSSQPAAAPTAGATSYAGSGAGPLTGFDLSSIQQMFTPGKSPKEWEQVAIDPEWQKQYQAGHYASVESALRDGGMKPTDGLYMKSADAPPPTSSKDGYWAMSGPAGVTGGGDDGGGRQEYNYQYIARPQASQATQGGQIPADLQSLVMQFLAGKPNG